jgi:hypothetical protein
LIPNSSSVNIQFFAKIIAPNGKVIDASPQWSVSDSGSTISTTGLYMAPSSIDQSRKITITASYDGVSNSVVYQLVKEIPTETERSNRYYMYADMYADIQQFIPGDFNNLNSNMYNPGNDNGGYIGIFPNSSTNGFSFKSDTSVLYEGSESLKLAYDDSVYGGNANTGIFFVFGFDGTSTPPVVYKNLNGFTKLKFCIYSLDPSPSTFSVKLKSKLSSEISQSIALSGSGWQMITINIPLSINMAEFQKLVFCSDSSMTNTVYLDNIYFEK